MTSHTRLVRKIDFCFFVVLTGILFLFIQGSNVSAQSAYQSNVLALGPVAYWRLNDTTVPNPGPATAVDASGHSFNGTYGTAATDAGNGDLGPTPPAFPGFESTNGGAGTVNNVNNSYITVPALNLNTNVVTITMWIYPQGNQVQGTGLFFWRGSSTAGLIYNNLANNNELAFNWDNNSTEYFWQSGLVPPVNMWSLVALVVTPTNGTIYLINANGLNISTLTNANPIAGFDGPSTIGADPFAPTRNFNGFMDEVAVFNQALSTFQIAGLYTTASHTIFSPNITIPPAPEEVYSGRNAQFSVTLGGLSPFSYQWYIHQWQRPVRAPERWRQYFRLQQFHCAHQQRHRFHPVAIPGGGLEHLWLRHQQRCAAGHRSCPCQHVCPGD